MMNRVTPIQLACLIIAALCVQTVEVGILTAVANFLRALLGLT